MIIDRNIIYKTGCYQFRNFINMTDEEKEMVWKWRNEESVRRYMYNKDIIPFGNHLRFLEALVNRDDVYYWVVEKDGEIIGVTDLTSVDLKQAKAELGYYMKPSMQKKGIGIDFAFHNFMFAFCEIGVETLVGGIDKHNYTAIILDSYLGCVLNQDDLENLKDIDYIRWEANRESFLEDMEGMDDFRKFVRYSKENKFLIDKIKQYA